MAILAQCMDVADKVPYVSWLSSFQYMHQADLWDR